MMGALGVVVVVVADVVVTLAAAQTPENSSKPRAPRTRAPPKVRGMPKDVIPRRACRLSVRGKGEIVSSAAGRGDAKGEGDGRGRTGGGWVQRWVSWAGEACRGPGGAGTASWLAPRPARPTEANGDRNAAPPNVARRKSAQQKISGHSSPKDPR